MGMLRWGILGLLGRCRDGVEADVREEHDRCALADAAEAVWGRERCVELRVDVHRAHADEERQDHELEDHHHRVHARALAHPR
jgi:hypothetical protein